MWPKRSSPASWARTRDLARYVDERVVLRTKEVHQAIPTLTRLRDGCQQAVGGSL